MNRAAWLILSAIVIALDAWTKAIVLARIPLHASIEVVPGLINLVHVRNTGVAFGIGNGSTSTWVPLLLNGGAIAVLCMIVYLSLKTPLSNRMEQAGFHLVLGGAIGNMIDRFRLGSVVDFVDVFVTTGGREHHWPAFNVADSSICVGIGFLLLTQFTARSASAETPAES